MIKKKQITALVTGSGGFGAINIIKSLRSTGNYRVIATDIFPVAAGLFRADRGYLVPQEGEDGTYLEKMLEICREEKVDILIPGNDIEPPYLVRIREKLKEQGTTLLTGTAEFIKTAGDKWLTYKFLREGGFPSLRTYLPAQQEQAEDELGYPFVVKPRSGWGQRGFALVNSPNELDVQLNLCAALGMPPFLQEYIDESEGEFTNSVMIASDGEILGSIAMRRKLAKGSSREMFIDEFPEVRKAVEAQAAAAQTFGPLNFQCRLREGKAYTFEINARFSTTNVVRAASGFNEVDVLVRNFLFGDKQKIDSYQRGVAVMYQDYVFVKQDDFERWQAAGRTDRIGEVFPWL